MHASISIYKDVQHIFDHAPSLCFHTHSSIVYFVYFIIKKIKIKKERESKLLEIKITEIEVIVSQELESYINNDGSNHKSFTVPSEIRKNTLDQLYHLISKWNGVDISRTKSPLTRYRDYFCVAKNWWDQTKKKLFGAIFWLVIFKYIQKV